MVLTKKVFFLLSVPPSFVPPSSPYFPASPTPADKDGRSKPSRQTDRQASKGLTLQQDFHSACSLLIHHHPTMSSPSATTALKTATLRRPLTAPSSPPTSPSSSPSPPRPPPPSLGTSSSPSDPPPQLRSVPLHLPSSHSSWARLSYPPYHPSSHSPYPIVSVPLTFMPSADSSQSSFHSTHPPAAEGTFTNGPVGHSESHSVLAADTLLLTDETMASYPPLVLPPSPTAAAAATADMSTSHSLFSGSNAAATHDIEGGSIPSHLGEQHQDREGDEGEIDTTAAGGAASRPRSVVDFALDSASMHAGGRQVRRNMLARLSERWTAVSRRSRVILVWSSIMTLLKVTKGKLRKTE